jgi:hypothetical protein
MKSYISRKLPLETRTTAHTAAARVEDMVLERPVARHIGRRVDDAHELDFLVAVKYRRARLTDVPVPGQHL